MDSSLATLDRPGVRWLAYAAAGLAVAGLAACGAAPDAGAGADEVPVVEETAGDAAAASDGAALAAVRIAEPADGQVFQSGTVRVVLAAENIEIVPAGTEHPNGGHHHLFLNTEPTPEGEAIPAGVEGIVHLGQAQTEYVFEGLAPGEYTLIAVIGDAVHRVVPQRTDTVRFTVAAPAE